MNTEDAKARGIEDNDEARVFNDLSEMRIHVRYVLSDVAPLPAAAASSGAGAS